MGLLRGLHAKISLSSHAGLLSGLHAKILLSLPILFLFSSPLSPSKFSHPPHYFTLPTTHNHPSPLLHSTSPPCTSPSPRRLGRGGLGQWRRQQRWRSTMRGIPPPSVPTWIRLPSTLQADPGTAMGGTNLGPLQLPRGFRHSATSLAPTRVDLPVAATPGRIRRPLPLPHGSRRHYSTLPHARIRRLLRATRISTMTTTTARGGESGGASPR